MKKKVVIPIATIMFAALVSYLLLTAMVDFGYKINIVNGKMDGIVKYYSEEYYKDKAINGHAIVIHDGDSRKVYKLNEINADVKVSGYESTKYTVNTESLSYSIDISNAMPDIRKYLDECLSKRTAGTVGHFDVVDDEIVIVESEEGNLFDIDEILSDIEFCINAEDVISVNVDDYIVDQDESITAEQDKLEEILSNYDNFKIEYTDGFSIDKDILYKYGLIDVGDDYIDIVEDKDKIIRMLVSNLVDYNSVGIDRKFHTHDDKDIVVTGGTYGDYINYSDEAEKITPMIMDLESDSDRVPVMKQEAKFSLDTTYIEVDRVKQHVYYYKDGELVLDTDVVTGKPVAGRETPHGVYFILNKTTDANLIGATWNVKSDRWMGVTYQGVGFHDASWRSEFGGEIYKSNGSHGCINTPKEAMFELYDMVEEGTPVVIY